MLDRLSMDEIITRALSEDIGTGDITTMSTVPAGQTINGRFIAKEAGIICGLEIVRRVFEIVNNEIQFKPLVNDGDAVLTGEVIASISGPAAGILMGERVALNFLQRLSGISSKTASLAKIIEGTGARITDTRKTTPGLRVFEKYAVKIGGGMNHRFNLSDGVLIKDNHIAAAGSISNAIEAARNSIPHTLKIEVEVETMEQIEEALKAGADIIMLDNMDIPAMKEAVEKINGRALVEASGNMGDRDLRAVAETGVDIISVGALTHSVKAMDISLKLY